MIGFAASATIGIGGGGKSAKLVFLVGLPNFTTGSFLIPSICLVAEGNGDSTSAVLQKRRIDLLISVLERTCCAAPACALSSTHRCHPSLVVSKPPRGPSQYTAAPFGLHRFHPQRQVISADDNYVDSFLQPLLPAFLQDIVGTSSLDEYPDSLSSSTFPSYSGADSVTESPLGNIWRLDGEETKWSSGFPLHTHFALQNSLMAL